MKAILFDFDYTLADSSKGIISCVNYALGTMGLGGSAEQKIKKTIGLPLNDTFTLLTALKEERLCTEFKNLFLAQAKMVMARSTFIYEPVPPLIKMLTRMDIKKGIVSTKKHSIICEILGNAGLLKDFDVIIGGDDVDRPKPDPEGLCSALSLLNLHSEDCFYVGDGIPDAECSQRAGVKFIAVLTGTTPRELFDEYHPAYIIDNLKQLNDLIEYCTMTEV